MDLSRLIQMIVMRFAMRFLNRGLSAGLDRVMPPAKAKGKDMTPEERAQAKAAQDLQRRTRQAMRLTRRF